MIYVEKITVNKTNVKLNPGEDYAGLSAVVSPENATCKTVKWESLNTSVVVVNEMSGFLHARNTGKTTVVARAIDGSGVTKRISVTVACQPVEDITLGCSSISLEVGALMELIAAVSPSNAYNKDINWTSENTDIATVDDNGRVRAIAPGSTTITATAADGSGVSDYCAVTVEPRLIENITLNYSSTSVEIGKKKTLLATVSPSNATNKNIVWTSENIGIATVDGNGQVTGVAAGETTITATAADGSGIYATCEVSITPILVEGIRVSPTKKDLCKGETFQLSATIYPSDAHNKSITWSSSKSSVAEVDEATGLVTAKKAGSATITATTACGNKTSSCKITVDAREKAIVKKDSHSFYVQFADGKIWRSIGIDLSISENHSDYDMWNPDSYTSLNVEERRFVDNYENHYSEKQFALLYLLDPFGVEYYLSQYHAAKYATQFPDDFEDYNDKLRAYLKFKDRIYEEIFGRSPAPFVLSNDGRRVNVTWSYDRIDVFTDSELIFGAHNITDMIDLLERAADLIIHLVDSILPDTTKNKWIMLGVNVAKTLIFSGSIVEAFSDAASDFLDDYIEDSSNGKITIMEWPNPLLDNIYNFKKGIDEILTLPNIHDIEICDKVNKQNNYNVEFSNGTFEMFLGEIIELCS